MGLDAGPRRSPGAGVQYLVSVPAKSFTTVSSFFEGTAMVTGVPRLVTVSVAWTMANVRSWVADVVKVIRPIFPAALIASVIESAPSGPCVVGLANHTGRPDSSRLTTLFVLELPIVTPY